MKQLLIFSLICMAMAASAFAQQPPPPPPAVPRAWNVPPPPPPPPPVPQGAGKWWKNSATVRALELSDAQVMRLETVYVQRQTHLSELRAAQLREEDQLKALLDAEQLNEAAIAVQRVTLTAARNALETETSDMALEMRRVLTGEQWRRLEKIRADHPVPPPPTPPPPVEKEKTGAPEKKVYNLKTTPGIVEPVAITTPRPPYTPEARAAKIEGTLVIEATIRTDGSVSELKILQGLGYGLDESAIKTLLTKWKFQPGMLDGQPVNVRANIEITFRLY